MTDGTDAGTAFIRQESSYAEDAFDDASVVSSYDPFLEGGPLGRDKLIFQDSSYDEGTEEIRTSWTVVSKDGGYTFDALLNPSTRENGHHLGGVGNYAILPFQDPLFSPGDEVEIGRVDGTPDGSVMIGKSGSETFSYVGRVGGRLYFENDRTLWTTDGTEKGTFAFANQASSWQVIDFRGSPVVLSVSAGAFKLYRINFKSKTLLTTADHRLGPFAAVRLVEAPTYGAKKYVVVVMNATSSAERRSRVITYSGRTIRSIARSGDRTLVNGPEQNVTFRRNAQCDVK